MGIEIIRDKVQFFVIGGCESLTATWMIIVLVKRLRTVVLYIAFNAPL